MANGPSALLDESPFFVANQRGLMTLVGWLAGLMKI
jgi:hypothetical protein